MTMPRFNADASLYMGHRSYYGGVGASRVGGPAAIVAQQDGGCTVLCSDWIGCKLLCGNWPPGLSNYHCWLNCLAPSIACLQGSTCYHDGQPPDCCPEGRPKCCGSCDTATGKCDDQCVPWNAECP
jgi:hypothetical protein